MSLKFDALTSAAAVAQETEGKWFTYDDGVRFRLAAAENPAHRDWLAKRARKLTRQDRKSAATMLRMNCEGIALHVIRDWEGIVDNDGKTAIAYTPELGLRLLTAGTAAANDLLAWIQSVSNDPASFGQTEEAGENRKEEVAEAAAMFRGPAQVGS
ncbi:MAG: hypothetical protein JSR82_24430 [Verrucomicrobia bacterium]|nr:hypothetical protein [Verrucomicrobiota bacterium]